MSITTIKPGLFYALKSCQGKSFTVNELTQAYLSTPQSEHSAKKAARQYVYRNIKRLMNEGLVTRMPESSGWPRYCLAERFEQAISVRLTQEHDKTVTAKQEEQQAIPLNVLKDRLSKHKSEMLCSIGEAEEYNELCAKHPELRHKAQSFYNEARERSATLLGKVKALENLLAQHVSA